jgi:uncharacterized protein (DUF2141 family)
MKGKTSMRKFEQVDRKKKTARVQIPENPAGLSNEILDSLETRIKSALKDGYLPCGIAHKIGREANLPLIAVGAVADKLGIRVTNCQIGCFKVDKIIHEQANFKETDEQILVKLEDLQNKGELTCAAVFKQAEGLKLTPMAVADVANRHNMKIHHCQLGCF